MYILENESQLERATKKARKLKPLVRVIAFGVYAVRGSQGNFYEVRCERDDDGRKIVSCNCEGGRKNLVCFHSVAGLSRHIALASEQQPVAL